MGINFNVTTFSQFEKLKVRQYGSEILGKLIVGRYVAETLTTDAGCFGHVGLYQLCTKRVFRCTDSNSCPSTEYCVHHTGQ